MEDGRESIKGNEWEEPQEKDSHAGCAGGQDSLLRTVPRTPVLGSTAMEAQPWSEIVPPEMHDL